MVSIFVQIPTRYTGKIECEVNAENVKLYSLECDSVELDTKTTNIYLEDVISTVEINCNLDMNIFCRTLNGTVEINQLSATSKICIPQGVPFTVHKKGIGSSISYEKDGKQTDAFDVAEADNMIELNGIKSELIICTHSEAGGR